MQEFVCMFSHKPKIFSMFKCKQCKDYYMLSPSKSRNAFCEFNLKSEQDSGNVTKDIFLDGVL